MIIRRKAETQQNKLPQKRRERKKIKSPLAPAHPLTNSIRRRVRSRNSIANKSPLRNDLLTPWPLFPSTVTAPAAALSPAVSSRTHHTRNTLRFPSEMCRCWQMAARVALRKSELPIRSPLGALPLNDLFLLLLSVSSPKTPTATIVSADLYAPSFPCALSLSSVYTTAGAFFFVLL